MRFGRILFRKELLPFAMKGDTTMGEMLYKSCKAVAELNKVEGFDPMAVASIIHKENQEDQLYLEVKYRKLWFRLCNPNGEISKKLLSANENMAIIEARVYRDCKDPEECYIGSGFSQKFRTDDLNFGAKFLETAETAAIGRALAEAGYGIQFVEGEEGDQEQVDAGFPVSQAQKMGYQNPQMNTDNQMQGYPQAQGYEAFSQNQNPVAYQNFQRPIPPSNPSPQTQPQIDNRQPVEVILQSLTYEQAKQVEAVGSNKGKTLGQLAVENPSAIQWYANTYKGPNNLLRAAAWLLLEQAA